MRNRPELIVAEGKLEKKDRDMLMKLQDELIRNCWSAIDSHKQFLKAKAKSGEPITSALRQKAVLVDFHGVAGINAETLASRHMNLRVLDIHLRKIEDPLGWQVPADHLKPTMGWTTPWKAFEDSRLLVGVWKYGFGSWEDIQDDPELDMANKFFLSEPKGAKPDDEGPKQTPSAIHLVRRADYLLGLVKDYEENLKTYEEQERKKAQDKAHLDREVVTRNHLRPSEAVAEHPVASSSKTNHSLHHQPGAVEKPSSSTALAAGSSKRRATPVFTDSEEDDGYASMDEAACKEELRPVKAALKKLKSCPDDLPREAKLSMLKECLATIGKRIDQVVDTRTERGAANAEKWRKHLWVFASYFWPRPGVKYTKLKDIYDKMAKAVGAKSTSPGVVSQPPSKKIKLTNRHLEVGTGAGAGGGSRKSAPAQRR